MSNEAQPTPKYVKLVKLIRCAKSARRKFANSGDYWHIYLSFLNEARKEAVKLGYKWHPQCSPSIKELMSGGIYVSMPWQNSPKHFV